MLPKQPYEGWKSVKICFRQTKRRRGACRYLLENPDGSGEKVWQVWRDGWLDKSHRFHHRPTR